MILDAHFTIEMILASLSFRVSSYHGTILLNLNWGRLTGLRIHDCEARVLVFFITWLSRVHPFLLSFPLAFCRTISTISAKNGIVTEQRPLLSKILKDHTSFHQSASLLTPFYTVYAKS